MRAVLISLVVTTYGCCLASAEDGSRTALVDPVVQRLLTLATRDEACRQILSRSAHERLRPYGLITLVRVRHVVVCPQRNGSPLFAVFLGHFDWHLYLNQPKGHVVVIDGSGTIVPCHHASVWVDGEFRDINADGIIESVESWLFAVEPSTHVRVEILQVLPVERAQKPLLRIAYNREDSQRKWSWGVVATEEPGVSAVELGPKDPHSGMIVPQAVYRWSREERMYVGPVGGIAQPYIRIDRSSKEAFDTFRERHSQGGQVGRGAAPGGAGLGP